MGIIIHKECHPRRRRPQEMPTKEKRPSRICALSATRSLLTQSDPLLAASPARTSPLLMALLTRQPSLLRPPSSGLTLTSTSGSSSRQRSPLATLWRSPASATRKIEPISSHSSRVDENWNFVCGQKPALTTAFFYPIE